MLRRVLTAAALTAAALTLALAAPAAAHEIKAGPLTLSELHVRAPIGKVANTAAYLTAANPSKTADRLIAVSCACAARAELHDMSHQGGVMRMRPAPGGFEVPAGGTLVLAPGGRHVMLFGLKRALKEGERVDLELTFARAGKVKADFHVASKVPAAPAAAGHGHH